MPISATFAVTGQLGLYHFILDTWSAINIRYSRYHMKRKDDGMMGELELGEGGSGRQSLSRE